MLLRLLIVCVLAGAAYQGYGEYQKSKTREAQRAVGFESIAKPSQLTPSPTSFRCDGRTHCSQMTSCAEATYFLKNCPGTKMDGNNDGVPCEQQWCG